MLFVAEAHLHLEPRHPPKGRPSNFAAYVFVLTICVRHWNEAYHQSLWLLAPCRDYCTLRQGIGGKCRCQTPHGRRLPSIFRAEGPSQRLRREGRGSRAWRGSLAFFGLREARMTMAEGSKSLSDDSMRVAEEGIRGMINATAGATVTSYVMIEAALHILAAWLTSSQSKSTAAERDADVEELKEVLSSFIDYHRAAKWLPDPYRIDN